MPVSKILTDKNLMLVYHNYRSALQKQRQCNENETKTHEVERYEKTKVFFPSATT